METDMEPSNLWASAKYDKIVFDPLLPFLKF